MKGIDGRIYKAIARQIPSSSLKFLLPKKMNLFFKYEVVLVCI